MAQTTIDFGIDLGTTNSAIAYLEESGPLVIKNSEEMEVTPSVVRIDERGVITVGRCARQHLEVDPANTRAEFKRLMGTTDTVTFEKAKRSLTSEALSAEVLKALRADARDRLGIDPTAAVITVPALFELSQCEATGRAANLAGFTTAPLLQEPIASAIACGFKGAPTDGYWLVYDLGGGTFDTSLMNTSEGRMRVIDHAGDNFLGGKDFDWKVVELVIAQLQQQYALPRLARGNATYVRALARLKAACEEAKILLSRKELVAVQIPSLCTDEAGVEVDVDVPLRRADYERLILPSVESSVAIVQKLLTTHGLAKSAVEKLIFVGGPTLTPLIRSTVEAALGVKGEARVDPMTVVAQGAAVFAGTIRLEAPKTATSIAPAAGASSQTCMLQLEYPSISQDVEPYLIGRALSGTRPAFVQLSRDDGAWTSGRVPVDERGGFVISLMLRPRTLNRFTIEATDAQGGSVAVSPADVSITNGMTVLDPPLARSIGVSLASNTVHTYFDKGTVLPARKTYTHKTVDTLRPGQSGALISIPVVQGESARADRNRKVGLLSISAEKLKRVLPAHSDVEVTLEVDRSGRLRAQAYVPLLEELFEEVVRVSMPTADPVALRQTLEQENDRLDLLRERAARGGHSELLAKLSRTEADLLAIETLLQAAQGGDRDAGQQSERMMQALQEVLDQSEADLRWPELQAEAARSLAFATEMVIETDADEMTRKHLAALERELNAAMAARDAVVTEEKAQRLRNLASTLHFRRDWAWSSEFEQLCSDLGQYPDLPRARQLVDKGRQALGASQTEELKRVVRELWSLAPIDHEHRVRSSSGIR